MDTGLLAFWIILLWLFNKYISAELLLQGIDQYTLFFGQIIYSISTLGTTSIYTWRDIRVIYIRAKLQIESERRNLLKEMEWQDHHD
jgi:hypothetical protein